MLVHDDCLNALRHLKANSVDLIYLDPPFFTQKKHKQANRENTEEYAFDDYWDSIDAYRTYMEERLRVCHSVLSESGSLFLHCDKSASHHLRFALDQVFSPKNFQSEIIWTFRRWSNAKKGLLNSHQVIFFYSKTKNFKFYQTYQEYSPTTNLDQIFQERVRDKRGKSAYKKSDSKPVLIPEKKGVPLGDVWDIPYLNPKAKERVGYPTQKPIALLERVIALTTCEGDLVFDPFCGSGTTLVAAKLMNRRFIGMDLSAKAVRLSLQRVKNPIKSDSALLKNGRESFKNQCLKISEFLEGINAYPVQRNKGIDGFLKDGHSIKPIPIKVQRINESIEEAKTKLLRACKNADFDKKLLISLNSHNFEEMPVESLFVIPSLLASKEYISKKIFK